MKQWIGVICRLYSQCPWLQQIEVHVRLNLFCLFPWIFWSHAGAASWSDLRSYTTSPARSQNRCRVGRFWPGWESLSESPSSPGARSQSRRTWSCSSFSKTRHMRQVEEVGPKHWLRYRFEGRHRCNSPRSELILHLGRGWLTSIKAPVLKESKRWRELQTLRTVLSVTTPGWWSNWASFRRRHSDERLAVDWSKTP